MGLWLCVCCVISVGVLVASCVRLFRIDFTILLLEMEHHVIGFQTDEENTHTWADFIQAWKRYYVIQSRVFHIFRTNTVPLIQF